MNYQTLKEKIIDNLFIQSEDSFYPLVCNLHDSFEDTEFFNESDNSHNCLGCNFASYKWGLLHTVEAWIAYEKTWVAPPEDDLITIQGHTDTYYHEEYYLVSNILHWLNVMVSGYIEILKIIDLNQERRQRLFPVFSRIKLWSNFFKHPKAMILTHHASYRFDHREELEGIIFNEEKIKKYYRGEDKNRQLFQEITNNSNVTVLLPDLYELIEEFAEAVNNFQNLITENKLFKEELGEKTTYNNFYEDIDIEESENNS